MGKQKAPVYEYELADGSSRWRTYVTEWDPATGQPKKKWRKGFESADEAVSWRMATQVAIDQGRYVEPSKATTGEYLAEWLAGIRVRPTTYSNYRTSLEVHTLPRLGGIPLTSLSPEHLDKLYRALERHGKAAGPCRTAGVTCSDHGCAPEHHDGLAPKSVRHVHTALRKALQDAFERGHVGRNVADLANPPTQKQARSKRARDQVWTPEQLRRFIDEVREDRQYAAVHTFGTTGLRRAELFGTRWPDLDLEEGRLRVGRLTVTVVEGVCVWGDEGKTDNAERVISLGQQTVDVLRQQRRRQVEERLAVGPAWQDTVTITMASGEARTVANEFIFTEADGAPVHPGRFTGWIGRAAERAGLPPIGVHGLRHSYATLALRAGVEPEVVSERLGHADVATTLSIYSHVTEKDDRRAAETAEAAIFGATAGQLSGNGKPS